MSQRHVRISGFSHNLFLRRFSTRKKSRNSNNNRTMPLYKVHVKWGRKKYENVEVDSGQPLDVFKAMLFSLSGVPPERQKVMLKGSVLKDENWEKCKLKQGITLLMMGSEGEIPQAPAEKTKFVEDMTESQLASAYDMPAGLSNLGNTCYMNSTIQCLRNVPELKEALTKFQSTAGFGGSAAESVTKALKDLSETMEKTSNTIPPVIFLQVLHNAFPQFAEKTQQGVYAQQDANECWTQVVRMLQQKLPAQNQEESGAAASSVGFMDQYFGIKSESIIKCDEAPEEEPAKATETLFQLSCFISQDVKYLHTGLQSRLQEAITKNSPTLGRDASYTKTSKLGRLPAYLTVQLVRFYFKEKEAVNAKILKDVKFPLSLDVYDLCSDELKQKLVPMRDRFKALEDKKLEEAQKVKEKGEEKPANGQQAMEVDKQTKLEPYSFPDDVGSNNSGYYELTAVLTHQGRSSSSGHYVGWVRKKDDDWVKCDDDNISMVKSDDILKLSGGGDWHCAYVLLYAPRRLEVEVEEE